MPKRTDISSILVIGASLALAACDEQDISRSETTSLAEPTATVSECIEKFSGGKDVWSGKPVRASFVYDASDLEGDKVETFFGGDPMQAGSHSVTITDGDVDKARDEFLKRKPEGNSARLEAGDLTLIRVNYGPATFDEALREGCERLNGGASILQVTFSQGVP